MIFSGNSWGTGADGKGCVGCGPQEEFYGCSDIAIGGSVKYTDEYYIMAMYTTKAPTTTTTIPPPTQSVPNHDDMMKHKSLNQHHNHQMQPSPSPDHQHHHQSQNIEQYRRQQLQQQIQQQRQQHTNHEQQYHTQQHNTHQPQSNTNQHHAVNTEKSSTENNYQYKEVPVETDWNEYNNWYDASDTDTYYASEDYQDGEWQTAGDLYDEYAYWEEPTTASNDVYDVVNNSLYLADELQEFYNYDYEFNDPVTGYDYDDIDPKDAEHLISKATSQTIDCFCIVFLYTYCIFLL